MVSGFECAAIVCAVQKNCPLFYGVRFVVVNDHCPLETLERLTAKSIGASNGLTF